MSMMHGSFDRKILIPTHGVGEAFSSWAGGLGRAMLATLGLWCGLASGSASGQAAKPVPAAIDSLRAGHPRLFVESTTWTRLRDRRNAGDELGQLVRFIESEAVALLDADPVTYERRGKRMLHVSREALYRLTFLSLAYHTLDDARLLGRAVAELEAVLAFPDWNPQHYLDTAEMLCAVSIAYDWLHADLPPDLRGRIEAALIQRLRDVVSKKPGGHLWWMTSSINWNSVGYAGVTLAALSIADREPALAARALDLVLRHNPKALEVYAPEGVYPEGPIYWSYGTTFQAMLIDALATATGQTHGLEDAPGFPATGRFIAQLMGPTGLPFSFSDARPHRRPETAVFWFAKRFEDPSLMAPFTNVDWPEAERVILRYIPMAAVWWSQVRAPGDASAAAGPQPLWIGRSQQPLAIFRSPGGENGWFLATKGGSASLSHGHMDAGSFVLDALGVRWAVDLGLQDYHSLETAGLNLFDNQPGSDRWRVFRLNNHSHNTLTIDGQLHHALGHAPLIDWAVQPASHVAWASYDLSDVLAVKRAVRTFRFDTRGGRAAVRDQLSGLEPGTEVHWGMMTPAEIELRNTSAHLSLDARKLRIDAAATGDPSFEVVRPEAITRAFDAANPGYTLLVLRVIAPPSGEVSIRVGFSVDGDGLDLLDRSPTDPRR
jgi:hypothetical protein